MLESLLHGFAWGVGLMAAVVPCCFLAEWWERRWESRRPRPGRVWQREPSKN